MARPAHRAKAHASQGKFEKEAETALGLPPSVEESQFAAVLLRFPAVAETESGLPSSARGSAIEAPMMVRTGNVAASRGSDSQARRQARPRGIAALCCTLVDGGGAA